MVVGTLRQRTVKRGGDVALLSLGFACCCCAGEANTHFDGRNLCAYVVLLYWVHRTHFGGGKPEE